MAKRKNNTRIKKNNSKRIEEVINTDSDLMDKFYIVAGVILFLLCFYILTVYITNKNNDNAVENEKTVEKENVEVTVSDAFLDVSITNVNEKVGIEDVVEYKITVKNLGLFQSEEKNC